MTPKNKGAKRAIVLRTVALNKSGGNVSPDEETVERHTNQEQRQDGRDLGDDPETDPETAILT